MQASRWTLTAPSHPSAFIMQGVYSYIRVMPEEFILKSVVFKLISKEISRAEHEYMNIHPPPPPPQLTL